MGPASSQTKEAWHFLTSRWNLLSSSSSSPSLSLHLTGHPGKRSCGCSKLTSRFCPWPRRPFFCSLSPASPVSLILYKFVGFVLKFTRVFPDRPPPVPPPTPVTQSHSSVFSEYLLHVSVIRTCCTVSLLWSVRPPQHRELRADVFVSLVPNTERYLFLKMLRRQRMNE